MSKPTSEPMTERHQSENRKVQADKEYEAGKMSGAKYEQEIARANKAGKKGPAMKIRLLEGMDQITQGRPKKESKSPPTRMRPCSVRMRQRSRLLTPGCVGTLMGRSTRPSTSARTR